MASRCWRILLGGRFRRCKGGRPADPHPVIPSIASRPFTAPTRASRSCGQSARAPPICNAGGTVSSPRDFVTQTNTSVALFSLVIPCATWLVPESSRGHLWEWARPASQGLCLHVASQSWSTFRCDNTGQLITVVPFLLPPYVGAFAPPKNVAVPGSRSPSRVVE